MYPLPRWFRSKLVIFGAAVAAVSSGPGAVTASAASKGTLSVVPTALYFGNVVTGKVKRLSCTVTNTGSAAAKISRVHSSNAWFTVATPALPHTLAAGAKATFTVTFAPTAPAHRDATIVFTSNASNASLSLPIHGTGVQTGTLRAAPASVSFGSVQSGDAATKSVTVTNIGSSNVKISSDAVAGFPFGVTGLTLPDTLTPSESITFKVSFAPATGGARTGTLTLKSNASNSSLVIALSGTAVPPGSLSESPATVFFGTVNDGASSARTATLKATSGRVVISSATLSNSDFKLSGVKFPLKIASGQSATVALTFTPQAAGLVTGNLKFKSNAVNAAPALALQGHGAAAEHRVTLSWTASKSAEGYNVYRGTTSGGPYSKINSPLETGTSYSDTTVAAGDKYYYVTTAVGSDGQESGYSSQVSVTIPSP